MSFREGGPVKVSSLPAVEDVIEQKLEEIVILLDSGNGGNSGLYNEVISIIERCLIRIAMKRAHNVKTSAADFLGINRNTLHNKISKLNISD